MAHGLRWVKSCQVIKISCVLHLIIFNPFFEGCEGCKVHVKSPINRHRVPATSPLAPAQLHAHGAVLCQGHVGNGGGHQAAVQGDVLPKKKVGLMGIY